MIDWKVLLKTLTPDLEWFGVLILLTLAATIFVFALYGVAYGIGWMLYHFLGVIWTKKICVAFIGGNFAYWVIISPIIERYQRIKQFGD